MLSGGIPSLSRRSSLKLFPRKNPGVNGQHARDTASLATMPDFSLKRTPAAAGIVRCNIAAFRYCYRMMTKTLFKLFSWILIAAVVFVTVSPIGLRPHTMLTVSFDRAAAFALIGCAFAIAYPRRWLSLTLFLLAAAFGIELMQYVSPSRHPQFADASVKAAGAMVGMIAGKTVLIIRRVRIARMA